MGVVKKSKLKNEKKDNGVANDKKKELANGKSKQNDGKVKKKKTVSCLQCIKSQDDGIFMFFG